VVIATAEGIIPRRCPGYLKMQGGSFKATKSWAKSLFFRINFVKQKSRNKGKVSPSEFVYLKEGFLNNICVEVIMNDFQLGPHGNPFAASS